MKMKGLLHVAFAYLVTLGVPWATLQVLGKTPVWDMFWAGLALFGVAGVPEAWWVLPGAAAGLP